MGVVEESVLEQLLRPLLAEPPVIELGRWPAHGQSPREPFEWPGAPDPLDAAGRAWQTFCRSSDEQDEADAAAGAEPDSASDPQPAGSQWRPPGADEEPAPMRDAARTSRTTDPGPAVAALATAIDAVAAQDAAALPEAQALARARWLLQATERMRALSLEALADVETRTLHRLDDAPTVNAWVAGLAVPGGEAGDSP
jgi:hypothetical protein